MRARRRRGGFTLLEVSVALAILGVGMVAAIQAFGGALRLQDRAARRDRAVKCASRAMDKLMVDVRAKIASDECEEEGYQIVAQARRADAGDGIAPDDAAVSEVELWYLQVDVTWQDGAGAKTYTLRTLQSVDPNRLD